MKNEKWMNHCGVWQSQRKLTNSKFWLKGEHLMGGTGKMEAEQQESAASKPATTAGDAINIFRAFFCVKIGNNISDGWMDWLCTNNRDSEQQSTTTNTLIIHSAGWPSIALLFLAHFKHWWTRSLRRINQMSLAKKNLFEKKGRQKVQKASKKADENTKWASSHQQRSGAIHTAHHLLLLSCWQHNPRTEVELVKYVWNEKNKLLALWEWFTARIIFFHSFISIHLSSPSLTSQLCVRCVLFSLYLLTKYCLMHSIIHFILCWDWDGWMDGWHFHRAASQPVENWFAWRVWAWGK